MPTYRVYQVDAFTTQLFEGNPAGVVPDAKGLRWDDMLAIAREMNLSETAFVFPPEGPDHDVRVRFFTPKAEVPICGHATIATHLVRAQEGTAFGVTRQLTGAGILDVEVERDPLGHMRVWMHQQPGSLAAPLVDRLRDDLLAALGIVADDLDQRGPIQIVSTGHSKVVIPLRRRATLGQLKPDLEALERLSGKIGCNGFYPFTLDAPDPGALTHGRMFAPAIGIPEDPVTGNASGCLGVYLLHHAIVAADEDSGLRFVATQGQEVGRPGRVLVEVRREGPPETLAVRVGGNAVIAFQAEIAL